MSRLAGAVAIVTGASSGIGRAAAVAFAREGCRLALGARRVERLEKLRDELTREYGVEVFTEQVDVRVIDEAEAFVRAVCDRFGRIDVLLNNAGLARGRRPVEEGDEDEWRQMVETNLMGLLWMTRATIPVMRAQRSGHIINLGSVAGHEAYAGGSVYCATKAGVWSITQALRLELLGTNIRVSSVDPGLVETEFSLVRFDGDEGRARDVYKGMKPLTGDDVAECIVFVANRPPHVNIDDMIIKPTAQASNTIVYREE